MSRYSRPQRTLHWLIALLVAGVLLGGLTLGLLGFQGVTDLLGDPGRDLLYKYHKTGGLLILALMAVRLAVRIQRGKPAYDPPIAAWERKASTAVQHLLYLALFAMPVLGWLATDAADYPVEFFAWSLPQFIAKDPSLGETLYELHETVGWAIVVLLGLHVGGALKHAIIERDGVMGRIWPI